jgi:hypothetical protein
MPNIELHGFGDLQQSSLRKLATALDGVSFTDEIVITAYVNRAVNVNGDPQPFIRIVAPATSRDEIEEIERRLSILNIDIEVLLLDHFTPKK